MGVLIPACAGSLLLESGELQLPYAFSLPLARGLLLIIIGLVLTRTTRHNSPLVLGLCFIPALSTLLVPTGVTSAVTLTLSLLLLAKSGRLRPHYAAKLAAFSASAVGALLVFYLWSFPSVYGVTMKMMSALSAQTPALDEGPRLVGIDAWILPAYVLCLAVSAFEIARERLRGAALFAVTATIGVAHVSHQSAVVAGASLASLLALWASLPSKTTARTRTSVSDWTWSFGLIATCGLLAIGVNFGSSAIADSTHRVAFVHSESMSLELPARDWTQSSYEPQFGLWKKTLKASGIETSVFEETPTQSQLQEIDTLVLINNNVVFDEVGCETVWEFVKSGGTLLVLADHTDIDGQLGATNPLLAHYGIEVAFDSAIPLDKRWSWQGCFRRLRHPIHPRGAADAEYRISVGASLLIDSPAVPVLVGSRAYSDPGNYENKRAFLGDMRVSPGEQVGDVVLVAESGEAGGRVLVFGDTSCFQDSSILTSHKLVGSVTDYLLDAGDRAPSATGAAALLAVLGFAAGLIRRRRGLARFTVIAGVCGALFGSAAGVGTEPGPAPVSDVSDVAWFDLSHGSTVVYRGSDANSIDGLSKAFLRHDSIPIAVSDDFSEAINRGGRHVVIPTPRTPYSSEELASLRRFVDGGGRLWIFGGREEQRSCPGLFAEFGIEVLSIALGKTENATIVGSDTKLAAREAWPVKYPGSTPLATAWEYVLAARQSVGDGEVLVFSDPTMLLGRGLEQKWKVNSENAALFDAAMNHESEGER